MNRSSDRVMGYYPANHSRGRLIPESLCFGEVSKGEI